MELFFTIPGHTSTFRTDPFSVLCDSLPSAASFFSQIYLVLEHYCAFSVV